jgi:hypothetical protein
MCQVTKWTDEEEVYIEARKWAIDNCPSLSSIEFLDMSDISSWSGPADSGYTFCFDVEEDAVQFTLRWL